MSVNKTDWKKTCSCGVYIPRLHGKRNVSRGPKEVRRSRGVSWRNRGPNRGAASAFSDVAVHTSLAEKGEGAIWVRIKLENKMPGVYQAKNKC